jgi:hypothetical protein
MSTSLGDILTTQKNGVVALGDISRYTQAIANLLAIFGGLSKIGQAAMTTTWATLYTCPLGQRACVVNMNICNTTAAAIGVYVSAVPSGGTAGASNAIFHNTSVAANSTLQWTGSIAMTAGDTLQVQASAAGCTITASGGAAS